MKSIPVNVRKNLGTYILLTILVMTGMYIASAMAGITYSYDTANEEKTGISNSEDGLFQVFDPLSEEKEQQILSEGYDIERAFYYDVDMEDGSVIRVMKVRQKIDKIILDEGRIP